MYQVRRWNLSRLHFESINRTPKEIGLAIATFSILSMKLVLTSVLQQLHAW